MRPTEPLRYCYYCKQPLVISKGRHPRKKTLDHVHPKSRGGRDTVFACQHCNTMKGDMSMAAWAFFMSANPDWWRLGTEHVVPNEKLREFYRRGKAMMAAPLPPGRAAQGHLVTSSAPGAARNPGSRGRPVQQYNGRGASPASIPASPSPPSGDRT
ncbi:HNH endonuclease signature motif containing protein [Enterovirga sp. CN4-39]|uniref:HNH endonuclease signature motif containing protein n=1 Tax=Enterovirga sp. CN4-39 TaxID=3400910 RepID=UPI003BFC80FF